MGGDRTSEAIRAQLFELLEPVVRKSGLDLEEVAVNRAGSRSVVRVVVDSDDGLDLDAVAEVSRTVSEVLDGADETTWKSFRNLPQVHLIEPGQLNAYDVLVADYVVFTKATVPTDPGDAPVRRERTSALTSSVKATVPVTPPSEVADAQRQLRILQWAIPAVTGALVVVSAVAGEQQRPQAVARGLAGRLLGD